MNHAMGIVQSLTPIIIISPTHCVFILYYYTLRSNELYYYNNYYCIKNMQNTNFVLVFQKSIDLHFRRCAQLRRKLRVIIIIHNII